MYSNHQLFNSNHKHLDRLADCHIHCFPDSFATKLGKQYVRKTLEWFLVSNNRLLFHIEIENKIAGYCGSFIPSGFGDGSSSGMLQYAFKEAVFGMLKKPWLFLNKEIISFYPFIIKNIRQKIFGKKKISRTQINEYKNYQPHVGLVVIGVEPFFRGSFVFQELMKNFEAEAIKAEIFICKLSVKKDNGRAIRAYKKFEWFIAEEHAKTFVMEQNLNKV